MPLRGLQGGPEACQVALRGRQRGLERCREALPGQQWGLQACKEALPSLQSHLEACKGLIQRAIGPLDDEWSGCSDGADIFSYLTQMGDDGARHG